MRIELEQRRRLHEVKGATAVTLAPNAYEITFPRDYEAVQNARRPWTLEGWDGAVLVLTLDYPARRNALAMPLRTAMLAALERAIDDRAIRATWIGGKPSP